MISYDASTSRTPLLVMGAVVAGLALAVGAWWFSRPDASQQAAPVVHPAASASDAGQAPGHNDQLKRAAEALLGQPDVLADGRPADFDAAEWASLKEAISKSPNSAAELKRVAEYLRFQRGFELWQNMQEQGNTPERLQLGEKLMLALPARLSNQEVTLGEALMICAAFINESEPDNDRRDQKLEQCKVRLEQAAPKPSTDEQERDASCVAEWERRKAAITSEHYGKPPTLRATGQKQFEVELEKARVEVFSSAECTAPASSAPNSP
jgi:hypothetical protein